MQYEEFLQKVLQKLQEHFGEGYCFIPTEIPVNNGGVRHSLIIKKETDDISPCICMDGFFGGYLSGCSMDKTAVEIGSVYEEAAEEKFDLSGFSRWDMMRSRIRCRLANSEKNEATLSELPHRKILDLSVAYYVKVVMSGGNIGVIQVRNEHIGLWGVDEAVLYETAVSNMKDGQETELKSIDETLEGMLGKEWAGKGRDIYRPKIYVLGNQDFKYGAAGLLDKKALQKAAWILGKEFFILPSSVHEVLLIPVIGAEGEAEEYARIVKDVNDTQVLPEEILSYHVYRYSEDTEELTVAV